MTAEVLSTQAKAMDATRNEVLAEVRNHIGHLTLNRPAGLNALTLDMVRTLHRQLEAWARDSQVHAVVLRGAGKKPFAPAATSVRCMTATRPATPCTKIFRRGIRPRPGDSPIPQTRAGVDGRFCPGRRHGPGARRRPAAGH